MNAARGKRAMLVALEGVDWIGLTAGIAEGWLPAIGALARRGTIAPLRAPPSEQGRTGIGAFATGLPPERHGLFRMQEVWAGGLRPVTRASWTAEPVWERLARAGLDTAVATWAASAPGNGWTATVIDSSVLLPTGEDFDSWALSPDCARDDLRAAFRDLRTHPGDVTGAMLAPLIPVLPAIDQARDPRVATLALAMAAAATSQAAATLLIERQPQVMFVHQRWLGQVREIFDGATAPYEGVVAGAWRLLDAMIGRLVTLAGEDCAILLCSTGVSGRTGAFVMAGPGLPEARGHTGIDRLDVAPTLLAALGLSDPNLPGTPIGGVAWGTLQTLSAALPSLPPPTGDPALSALLDGLDYAPACGAPPGWHAAGLARLAEMLIGRDLAAAATLADAALAIDPASPGALSVRALIHVAAGEGEALPPIADALERAAPRQVWADLVRGAQYALARRPNDARPHLDRVEASGTRENRLRVGAAWLAANSPADAERVYRRLIDERGDDSEAAIGLSMALMAQRRTFEAESTVRGVLGQDPGDIPALMQLRSILSSTGRSREADDLGAMLDRLGTGRAAA